MGRPNLPTLTASLARIESFRTLGSPEFDESVDEEVARGFSGQPALARLFRMPQHVPNEKLAAIGHNLQWCIDGDQAFVNEERDRRRLGLAQIADKAGGDLHGGKTRVLPGAGSAIVKD